MKAIALDMYMVPTMMQRMWSLPEDVRQKYDLSSLKRPCMAAPCPPWLKEAFIEWFGPALFGRCTVVPKATSAP